MLPLGRSDPLRFFYAVVYVIRASQAALVLSAAFFLLGVWLAVAGDVALHMYFMTWGLLAFYLAVMYVQLPGFVNAAPVPAATVYILASYVAGTLGSWHIGFAAYLPFSLGYVALYAWGLWDKPTYYPNVITVLGLALLPTAATPLEALLSFPLASVYTLLYRIDASRARRRFSRAAALAVAGSYAAAFLLAKAGLYWAFLLPAAVLTAAARPRLGDAYGAASFAFRWLVPLSILHHHFAYLGFAVIMSGLCVPYFLPSILYREAPRYGPELLAIAAAALVTRLAGQTALAGVLATALVLYAAAKSLKMKKIPLIPPSGR
ncbi:MAG: hypothetical protein QXP31_00010 [Pyrobaculum sp.]